MTTHMQPPPSTSTLGMAMGNAGASTGQGAGYKTPSSSIAITAASSTHSGESSQLTLDLWKQGPLFDSEQADSKREVIYTLQFDRPFGGWDFVLRNVEGESAGRIFNARGDSSFWLEERGREPAECKSGMFSKAFKVEISGVIYEWKREGETVTCRTTEGSKTDGPVVSFTRSSPGIHDGTLHVDSGSAAIVAPLLLVCLGIEELDREKAGGLRH